MIDAPISHFTFKQKKLQFSRLCPWQQCLRSINLHHMLIHIQHLNFKRKQHYCYVQFLEIITPALITASPMQPCIQENPDRSFIFIINTIKKTLNVHNIWDPPDDKVLDKLQIGQRV